MTCHVAHTQIFFSGLFTVLASMTRPMTQAQRERQKRQQLVNFDSLRQRVKNLLDAHWEIQKQLKEAKRLKQEERYEKWIAGHGLSIPELSQEGQEILKVSQAAIIFYKKKNKQLHLVFFS